MFQLRRPYDLVALLHQEKRAHQLAQIKSQLIQQKHDIETDESAGSHGHGHGHGHHGGHTIMITDDVDSDDIEQLVYASNDHCHQAGKPLTQFDLYIGTQYFMAKHDWDVLSDVNKIKKRLNIIC